MLAAAENTFTGNNRVESSFSVDLAIKNYLALSPDDKGLNSGTIINLWRSGPPGVVTPAGQALAVGASITSSSGHFHLIMQADGHLVMYDVKQHAFWATNTSGKGGVVLIMQDDGNVVLSNAANDPLWASNTAGPSSAKERGADLSEAGGNSGEAIPEDQIDQIKASMRATWMAGDFGVVARTITGSAEAFIARLAILPGTRLLDVACGTGNLAIPAARAGAIVTGVDIAANLLVQARERAAADHLSIQFDEGDAEALPYPDFSFDVVVSMFGAMFAPRPSLVASELGRVLKPGGKLAMANWNSASFTGRMFAIGNNHAPPPPGIPPPVLWGDENTVRERLAPHFTDITTSLVPVDFDLPSNAAGAVAFFRKYFGPTQVAFNRLDEAGRSAFTADLEALYSGANVSPDPTDHTLIHNEFLQVTATRL